MKQRLGLRPGDRGTTCDCRLGAMPIQARNRRVAKGRSGFAAELMCLCARACQRRLGSWTEATAHGAGITVPHFLQVRNSSDAKKFAYALDTGSSA